MSLAHRTQKSAPARTVERLLLAAAAILLFVGSFHAGHAQERSSGVQQVKTIGFTVGDVDREVGFFANVLGFEKIADFRPSSIAMEKDYRRLSAHRPAPFAWQAQDLHGSGAAGDATRASAEKGERLLDHGARAFCELLADVDKFDPDTLSSGPKA